jgi:opacity protein-like surface antigen
MKWSLLIATIALSLMFSFNTSAQENLSVHVGAMLPIGSFARDNGGYLSNGAAGLDLGVEYAYPLKQLQDFDLFGGIDINYSGLKKSYRNDNEDMISKFPKYLNIPVSAGLRYNYKLNDKIALFGKGGLALDFFKVSKVEVRETINSWESTTTVDLSVKPGFILGGGCLINNSIEFGLSYFGFSAHKLEGVTKIVGRADRPITERMKTNFLTLTAGVKLEYLKAAFSPKK